MTKQAKEEAKRELAAQMDALDSGVVRRNPMDDHDYDDEEMERTEMGDDSPECQMCGGPLMPLGQLGSLMHWRCRNCGAQFEQRINLPRPSRGRERNPHSEQFIIVGSDSDGYAVYLADGLKWVQSTNRALHFDNRRRAAEVARDIERDSRRMSGVTVKGVFPVRDDFMSHREEMIARVLGKTWERGYDDVDQSKPRSREENPSPYRVVYKSPKGGKVWYDSRYGEYRYAPAGVPPTGIDGDDKFVSFTDDKEDAISSLHATERDFDPAWLRQDNPTQAEADGWVRKYKNWADNEVKASGGRPVKPTLVIKITMKDGKVGYFKSRQKFDTDLTNARVYHEHGRANEAAKKIEKWMKQKNKEAYDNIQSFSVEDAFEAKK